MLFDPTGIAKKLVGGMQRARNAREELQDMAEQAHSSLGARLWRLLSSQGRLCNGKRWIWFVQIRHLQRELRASGATREVGVDRRMDRWQATGAWRNRRVWRDMCKLENLAAIKMFASHITASIAPSGAVPMAVSF